MGSVLGIAEHSGWAEFVVVGVQGGAPVVLSRQRVALVAADLPHNPYHHEGLSWPLAEAQALVDKVRRSVAEYTRAALTEVQGRHGVTAVTLQESPYPALPATLAEVLTSYSLTCSADGMMYREALAEIAADLGMEVVRYPRKTDPMARAAKDLGVTPKRMEALLTALGQPLGTPWRKEHRVAAAAALSVLVRTRKLAV